MNFSDDEGTQQDPRTNRGDTQRDARRLDLFDDQDPWHQHWQQQRQPRGIDRPRPQRPQFAGAVTNQGTGLTEQPPRRMMHDVFPEWDGTDPHKNVEPYLNLLKGWLLTTATIQNQ